MIKFLKAQNIAQTEIHRQLYQVYVHTRLDGQHISCRSSTGRCLIIIHPIARTSCPVISICSYSSRNSCPVSVFRMTKRRRWVSHSGSNPRRLMSMTRGHTRRFHVWQMSQLLGRTQTNLAKLLLAKALLLKHARTCFLLLKIWLAYTNRAKSKSNFWHVQRAKWFLLNRAKTCSKAFLLFARLMCASYL